VRDFTAETAVPLFVLFRGSFLPPPKIGSTKSHEMTPTNHFTPRLRISLFTHLRTAVC